MRLPFWDQQAQDRLGSSHALLVGCGALGCPCADLLVRAGVGRITIVDRDLVETSNLHRQTLFTNQDALDQTPKAQAAKARLLDVNPDVEINALVADFGSYDAERFALNDLLGKADVLVDGTDNFETRFLMNDVSVCHSIPYVYGGAIGTQGMAGVFQPEKTPCLRCLFDSPPPAGSQPTCETAGVFSPVSSIIASYQASEALKLLIGAEERVMGSMLEFDLWEGKRRRIEFDGLRDPSCPCCVQRVFEFLEREDEETVSICGKDAIQINPHSRAKIDLDRIQESLSSHGKFRRSTFFVQGDIQETKISLTVFHDGRAIIEGTDEPSVARSLYARYIGS
jgi:molybdopterin-synthase adenylyltransferase